MWRYDCSGYEGALKAEILVAQLPEEIQNSMGNASVKYSDDGTLQLALYGEDTAKVCAQHGAVFNKPQISEFSGRFFIKGNLGDAEVTVWDLPPPAGCEVVKETYEAVRYKSVCG